MTSVAKGISRVHIYLSTFQAQAALSEFFVDLPFHLLKASIDHPELTVQR